MGQAQNGAARVPPEMVAALDRGALVLTSSSRLARSLRRQYSLRKKQSGATQWPSPRILSWSGWLSDLWKLCLFQGLPGVPLLLNTFQERMLWNSAIRQSPEAAHLLQIDSTAAAAQQAWNLLHRYRIPVQRAAFQVSEDTAAFFEWSRVYKTQIKRLNALDAARLSDWIRDRFVQGALAAPSQLWLAGFEESTPQQEVLLKALEQAGCPIVESQFLDLPAQDTALHSYPDQTSEVYAAAAWAREKLERDPGCSVGIVTPNLTEVRAFAARALRELLDDAFHIPTGRPLGSLPIIHAALLVLETFLPRLERETVTGILLSPYLAAGEEERAARARLDATLRSYGGLHWPVQALADAAMRENAQGGIAREPESGVPSKVGGAVSALCACPNLVAAVERCEKVPDALPPSAWAHLFAQRLQNFGWLTGPLGNRRK
ncbi:MAG: hypothetical protein JJE04_19200, partial [Acidobacteriia bacterium]|nr:hypothetical protein [Terriglobia bacterium]